MSFELPIVLFCLELLLRSVVEIRERRRTQLRGGIFSIFRLIPLLNDILPLPESRTPLKEDDFVKSHEEGHTAEHHAILRNLVKVLLLMLAVWFFVFLLSSLGLPLLVATLWLHWVAIPFRIVFHYYCWTQEYEADRYAFKNVGRQKTKESMRNLAAHEIPYTSLFALLYREHPTAHLRKKRLL